LINTGDIIIAYRKFTLKHEIKNRYLIVGVPVLIAIIIIAWSCWTLYSYEPSESKSLGKKVVYEEYMRNVGKAATEAVRKEEPWVVRNIDHTMILAVLIAIVPYSVNSFVERMRIRRYEEEYSEFLFEISELLRSGIDPMKSLVEISKTGSASEKGIVKTPKAHLKALTPLIKGAASMLTIGHSFEHAMMKMASDTKSELIRKYAYLVVMATYTGGEVSNIIFRTSADMKTFLKIQKEKESDLRQYMIIFYAAHLVLIAMVYILCDQLLPYVENIELGSGGSVLFGGTSTMLGGGFGDIEITRYLFHMIMINAFAMGLAIGKISYGSIKEGLLHSSILMIISYIACLILIIPGVSTDVGITVVSGDQQTGQPLVMLKDPVVFQVMEKGEPYTGKVKISVKGPEGKKGRAEPNYAKPDKDGMISTKITLGSASGLYTITAEAGGAERITTATARSYKPGRR
jgi:flagellar protein FlaJ